MGGKGSGGRRPGSGRKRKSDTERFIDGNAGHRAADVLRHPSAPDLAPLPTVDEADAPNDLSREERLIWLELAPYALRAGTLTPASSMAFRVLCRNIVLERLYGQSVTDKGTANHRGMIQRVEVGLDAFQLRPQGRRMQDAAPIEAPVNKLNRFLRRG